MNSRDFSGNPSGSNHIPNCADPTRDWENPVCEEWVAVIEEAVKRAGPDVVLVAHSLACLVVAHWAAAKPHSPIKAALLVAVPNSKGPNFPAEARGFSETPTEPFSFRSIVVVSDNDPYGSPEHAERLAAAWGSHVVHIGNRGHINANSGLGATRFTTAAMVRL